MKIYFSVIFVVFISCVPPKEAIQNAVLIDYSVVNSFPHDKTAFTQGLVIHKGELYESTGQDDSWIGIVNVKTGVADKKITLSKRYFGEGITILNNKIYQLTWENRQGFVYDLKSFEKIDEFKYKTEGWGLTHNDEHLIMSDGTANLYLLDTVSLSVTKTITINYKGQKVNSLNELEFINGYVFANIWRTNRIAKIDLTNGEAVAFIDLTPLAKQAKALNSEAEVLNGIAWHDETKSLLVTGKYWPFIYVLKLKESI